MALGSVRSCGVTTLAAGLVATWPEGRRVLLVEADPAGGTLAAGSGWPPEPSLVSLAAAARRGGDPGLVWGHCHHLPGGAPVLAAPAFGEQARGALAMVAPLLDRLREVGADVIIDCGRFDPGSPSLKLWEGADRPLLAVRPCLADLHAVACWVEGRPLGRPVGVVTVGDGPYPDNEIAEALGSPVLAQVPWDRAAADALVSVAASARQIRLAPLVRAARTIADHLSRERDTAVAVTKVAPDGEPRHAAGGPVSVGTRVWRAWRPDTRTGSPNGSVPEEAGR